MKLDIWVLTVIGGHGGIFPCRVNPGGHSIGGGSGPGYIPGGKLQYHPLMFILPNEMQMLKNQRLQGICVPEPVGVGLVTEVVIGRMIPGGQVVHTGSGVVVEVVVGGGVGDGAADQRVTRLQSTDTRPAVEARKVTILVAGQA
jgi:hypothetical protein